MLRTHLFALISLSAALCGAFAQNAAVELTAVSEPLQPATQLELRFVTAMVAESDIGKPADPLPLVIQPHVAGKFVWRSLRSGTFTPETPWPLSTTLRIVLREGLTDANGKPVVADFEKTLQTPGLALKGWDSTPYIDRQNAPADPRLSLLFNTEIATAAAPDFIEFVADNGTAIAAKVEESLKSEFRSWRARDHSLLSWGEMFRGGPVADGPRGNQLMVTPIRPLPPGTTWNLAVRAGLPARETHVRLLAPVQIPIGTVQPFTVRAEATSSVAEGRQIVLNFSKQLSSDLSPAHLDRWLLVSPSPEKFSAQIQGSQIALKGEFALGKNYRVTVRAGLPSAQPFVLERNSATDVVFSPIVPRIAFQQFAAHQRSSGLRQLHLLALNAPRIKVTAKLFDAETLPRAVTAYEKSFGEKIAQEKIPGRSIWSQEIDGTAKVDVVEEIALSWDEIIGAHKAGAVLLTAEQIETESKIAERPGAQTLVQLTDLGVVWKRTADEIFVHVFSLTTQRGLADVRLQLLNENEASVGEAMTDRSGVARLPRGSASRLLVKHGLDTHLVNLESGENHVSLNRLRMRDFDGEDEACAGSSEALLFTDRGVYKPGETAHLKAIVRDWRDGKAALPPFQRLHLRVSDPRGREVLAKVVTLSDTGSFSEDIVLPAGKIGSYSASVMLVDTVADENSGAIATHRFEAQEYRSNAFEITISGAKQAVAETPFELPVSAKYYMGKPLTKAKLTWSLDATDESFQPADFSEFAFGHAIDDYRLNNHLDRLGSFYDQGAMALDEHGSATVALRVPINRKAPQPRMARLLCEITDLNQQTVSQAAQVTVHSSNFYLGMRRLPEVIREGEPIAFELIAVGTDGTPRSAPVAATIRLTRIEWQTNRIQTAGDGSEYRSEPHLHLIAQRTVKTCEITKQEKGWSIAAPSPANEPFRAHETGQYLLEAATRDDEGRDVVTTVAFHVSGEGDSPWDYRNPFQIEIVADRDEYKTGETATLLVKTPIEGEALVTIERERVLRSFITTVRGSAPTISVPVEETDAPNVFVSVVLLRGAADSPRKIQAPEYRIGYCELKVIRPDSRLTVYVRPAAPTYEPGQEVRINCEVLDVYGRAVPGSEVTLYAVDEGVLSLTGYKTPDPLAFFYRPRPLAVRTALTLPTLLDEDPDARDFVNKGYLIGGGGESGANPIRKKFLACAFWNAAIRTDENGRASALFAAPDGLTRYRVIGVVHTATHQFGSGDGAFEVSKSLMLEPALPRFANVGDKLVLRAVLHNATDLPGSAEVRVTWDDTVQAAKTTQRVQLAARDSLAVDFPVEFAKIGRAQWQWAAHFVAADGQTNFQDRVQTQLKVGFPAPLLRELRVRRVPPGEMQLLEGMDPQVLEGNGTIRVSITNSRAIELQETLRQLLHYPYGCVEQTTSSTLPWLGLRDMRRALPALQRSDAEIASAVQRGVDRLLSMQTSSGGLAYWPGESEPMLWGSAYGGMGLLLAKEQGADVPKEELDRLLNYISEQLRGMADHHDHYGLAPRCLALYTLALAHRAEPAYHEVLFKQRARLSAENRALLGLAIQASNGPASMIKELLAMPAAVSSTDAWFSSHGREKAMSLLAWCRHDASAPSIERLAAELFDSRRGGHWSTTQGNAWALLALADYFQHVEKEGFVAGGKLSYGTAQTPFAMNEPAQMFTTAFAIGKENRPQALQLANSGSGRLFTEVEVEAQPASMEQSAQDSGYAIERIYEKIEDDGTVSAFDDVHVGDRVLVTLSLDVRQPAEYVAIDDPLPAIFEAVNPVFQSQETRAAARLAEQWISSHKELRDDRALFFANALAPGRYRLHYLARVCAAGSATAPSAKIEEMYHPERFGLSGSTRVNSHPLK